MNMYQVRIIFYLSMAMVPALFSSQAYIATNNMRVCFREGKVFRMVLFSSRIGLKRAFHVRPYSHEKDWESITQLAYKELPALATFSWYTHKEYLDVFNQQIVPALSSNNIKKYVAVRDGESVNEEKLVGFVTYSIREPFGYKIAPAICGRTAWIHHLAIEKAFRRRGYGYELVQEVLKDCRRASVGTVSLVTTSHSDQLARFYGQSGFYCHKRSSTGAVQFERRLKPSLLEMLLGGWGASSSKNSHYYHSSKTF